MSEKRKRIIAPPQRGRTEIILIPAVENILGDITSLISQEVYRLVHKSRNGTSLEIAEAKVLQGYIRSLVELSKESRDRDEGAMSNMSTIDLLTMVTDDLTHDEFLDFAKIILKKKKQKQGESNGKK